MKKILTIICALALLFGVERFCHLQTGGFNLSKIRSSQEGPLHPLALEDGVKKILEQPYRFLDSGAQAFAFASDDGQYVLKFFRHHRTRHPLRPVYFLLPASIKARLLAVETKRMARLEKDFSSYRWAISNLKEETAIIAVELEAKKGDLPLTLFDKIGVRHRVNGANFEFILQKRALPFYSTLEKWIEDGDLDKAREGLSSLLDLLQKRIQLGRADKDPDLRTNFGFIGTKAVEFDAGRFREDAPRANEIALITRALCSWLEERAPELALEVEGRL